MDIFPCYDVSTVQSNVASFTPNDISLAELTDVINYCYIKGICVNNTGKNPALNSALTTTELEAFTQSDLLAAMAFCQK